jgi:hypothetical protein
MRFGPFFVYAVSLIVATAGLWVVLAIGSHLSAPLDLSGDWTLVPLHAAAGNGAGGAAGAGAQTVQLRIEQSGQFMWIFDGDKRADLRMIDAQQQPAATAPTTTGHTAVSAAGSNTRYSLASGSVSANFELIDAPDAWKLTLVGMEPGVYRATRKAPEAPVDQSESDSSPPANLAR